MKDFRLMEEKQGLKKRFHSGVSKKTESKTVAPRSEQSKVVVLKKTESNRLEDLLFKNTANKNTLTARNERQMEKTFLGRPNRDGKVYSIEDYIPVRKSTVKNQPFVFGLSEKQLNPEKNR